MKRISDKIEQLLNFRIKAELESAAIYDAMSNCLAMRGFVNTAAKWKGDATDERKHAEWAIDYMITMDAHPVTPTVEAPKQQRFADLKEIVDKSLEHEYLVTQQCTELAKVAMQEGDLVTYEFVSSKYLSEQIEEIERLIKLQRYITTMGNVIDTWIQIEADFAK